MRSLRLDRLARLIFWVFGLAAAPIASAQTAPPQDAEAIAAIVDPAMAEWLAHKGTGAVVVVVRRDGQIFAKGYGSADAAAGRRFTADATLARPGSISKLFTGIAVMQLVEEGKLDLDRDIADYVDFAIPTPPGGVPVTLRRLLTHRAGFEEHAKDLFGRGPQPMALRDWLVKSQPPRLFPAGDIPAYSNYGVALAGYVVERVSGEPFADYMERHILEPLGMRRSSFRQPPPADLAPMTAKGYRGPGAPPLSFYETIHAAPAGALAATGEDMGRFMRALLNGGELDGARILSRERLEEMMRPSDETEAGSLGLVFFGRRIGGHAAVGHGGGTMSFFSDLELFRDEGVGVFVSQDGFSDLPHPLEIARMIAERFIPPGPRAAMSEAPAEAAPAADPRLAGAYQPSRRAESSLMRINALLGQQVVAVEADGRLTLSSALWPFGGGEKLRRVGANLYESPSGRRLTPVFGDGAPYFASPALRLQRVPWFVDARWIAPALAASLALALATLLGSAIAAGWRFWRGTPPRLAASDRRLAFAVRLVLLVDIVAVVAVLSIALFVQAADASRFDDSLDPWLLGVYALAWTGVAGAALAVVVAADFWRRRVGGRCLRLHHGALAAGALTIAYVFVTFHIAGTTLNY